jgi:hypothetical protein
MSGFFDDLEQQLVHAGQARQRRGSATRHTLRAARPAFLAAAGTLALAAMLVGLVVALGGKEAEEQGRRVDAPAASVVPSERDPKRKTPTVVALVREGDGTPAIAGTARIGKTPGGERALTVNASGIAPPGNRYALWTVGRETKFFGFFPSVNRTGRLRSVAGLTSFADVREILVTREASDRPERPGEVVLRGRPAGVVVRNLRPSTKTRPSVRPLRKLRPGTKLRPFMRPSTQTGRLPNGRTYVVTAQPVDRGPAKLCLSITVDGSGFGKGCGAAPVAGRARANLYEAPGGGWIAYGVLAKDDPATQVRVQGAGEIASVRTRAGRGALKTWAVFVPKRCAPLVRFEDGSGKELARDRPNPRPGDIEDCP